MKFVFADLETSGANTSFDCVLEACFILTNDKLQELDRIHVKNRLEEGLIPNLGALNVTGFDVNWLKQNPSPYQSNQILEKKLLSWGPVVFLGYNSQLFDWIFLSKTFFRYLKPPYFLNTKGNKIGDVLPVIRAAKLVDNSVIETPLTEKGNPSFKLSDLMKHQNAHGAVPDTEAVKTLSEIIVKNPKTKPIWDSSLMTLSRQECGDLLTKDKVVTHTEWFYGRLRMYVTKFLFSHPIYVAWATTWDLQHSPEDYIKMDYKDLKIALSKAPKVLRTIKTNRSPVLLNPSYGLKTDPYKIISPDEMQKRIQILDNSPEFLERINSILIDNHEEKASKPDKENLQPEETLYSGGFASQTDSLIMEKFHTIDWKERVPLIEKFNDDRYSFFAKRLIYQEAPDVLPQSYKKEIMKNIADRLFSTNKQQWTTIPEFYRSIDDMRNKHENDEKIMNKLEEYNNFVSEIEKKYEAA